MSIHKKLCFLLFIPMMGILFLGGRELLESHDTVKQMDDAVEMADLAVHFSALIHETQKERGCTAVFLSSKGERFGPELEKQRAEADKHRHALDVLLAGFSAEKRSEAFRAQYALAIGQLDQLDEVRAAVSSQRIALGEALSYYTGTHDMLFDLLRLSSQDIDDRDMALMNNAYVSFLRSKDRAGIERAVLSATFARDSFAAGQYAKAIRLIAAQDAYMHDFEVAASEEAKAFFDQALSHPSVEQVASLRQTAFSKQAEGGFEISAKLWFDTITLKINQLKSVDDFLAEELRTKALETRSEMARARLLLGAGVMTVLVVLIVGGLLITRSITRPLIELTGRLQDIAQGEGDLTQRMDESRKDEIGVLSKWFNRFVVNVETMIIDLGGMADNLATSATQIATSSEEMATGMDNQTVQIDEISRSIEEMSASVIEVARKSVDASTAAEEAGRVAEEGGQVVRDTIDGMHSLDQAVTASSDSVQQLGQLGERIGEVISVINDIADQTNLLALNAAIEAARAGEHGRGFAVVADEVRKLADRTTKATDEVGGSILAIQTGTTEAVQSMDGGTEQVKIGVQRATVAGENLEKIVTSAVEVSSMVQSIAAAAELQSSSSEQVNRSAEQIAAVSRESGEGAAQAATAATAATDLSEKAEQLRSMVGRFKVSR